MRLATLTIIFLMTPALASQKPATFDICTQDESGAPSLRVNTSSGAYEPDAA